MSNFNGWLIKFGNYQLPNKFLKEYGGTPNQRLEIDSYRDVSMLLHRETSPNFKSTITLSFIPLTLEEMILVDSIVNSGITDKTQRMEEITYWNNETFEYTSGTFYIPNLEKTIYFVDESSLTMFYKEFDLELIEY